MQSAISRRLKSTLAGAAVLFSGVMAAAGPDPDHLDSVWVSDSDGLTKLDADSGNALHRDASLAGATALAVDERGGLVWVLHRGALSVLSLSGEKQTEIAIPGLDLTATLTEPLSDQRAIEDLYCNQLDALTSVAPAALLPYAQLAVDDEGIAWMGLGDRLYRITLQGEVSLIRQLPELITGLATETARRKLWVGQCDTVRAYDRSGEDYYSIGIDPSRRPIRSIAFDDEAQRLWVLVATGLHAFDVNGVLTTFRGLSNGDNPRWVGVDGTGGAWAAGGNGNMWRIDANGTQVVWKRPFDGAALDFREHITGLATNTRDGSAWVGGYTQVAQVAFDGTVTKKLALTSFGASAVASVVAVSQYADTIAPDISIAAPTDGAYVTPTPVFDIRYNDVGQGADPDTLSVKIGETAVPVTCTDKDGGADCSPTQALLDGTYLVGATIADHAGNVSDPANVTVAVDTTAPSIPYGPAIDLSGVVEGRVTVTGVAGSVEGGATVIVTNTRTGQRYEVNADANGSFLIVVDAAEGDVLHVAAQDPIGNTGPHLVRTVPVLPPDPASIAPPLSKTGITAFHESTAFLYSGANPIQTGVTAGTIQPSRAAVIRGQVFQRDNSPLSGVTITVKDHPEYGQTLSRADGRFDLAVNGGGVVTLNYQRTGYLAGQRQVDVPWRDYVFAEDIALVRLDDRVSVVNLDAGGLQLASGTPVTDADGTRQATILFQPGTAAEMILPDGSVQPLTQLSIRATEYTVGYGGQRAMPGKLPPSSGYTYAVELSVDQALAAGAKSVKFSRPAAFYVENFIGFPTGIAAPAGYYDLDKAGWIASDNGRVIQILAVDSGFAQLDISGTGQAATQAELDALGVTSEEQAALAQRYTAGQSLWRVPVGHFSAWDVNWGSGPPPDGEFPDQPDPKTDDEQEDPDVECGSIVCVQNQTLAEAIPVTDAPFDLWYSSDRVLGRKVARTLDIQLTGSRVPSSLRGVRVTAEIAGRKYTNTFGPQTNQRYSVEWDGRDAFGRQVFGTQKAHVLIEYLYKLVYYSAGDQQNAFARFGYQNGALSASRETGEATLNQEFYVDISAPDARKQGFGGWTASNHHDYDMAGQRVLLGTGEDQRAVSETMGPIIETLAQVTPNRLIPNDVALSSDGTVYISTRRQVFRMDPDGSLALFAGNGSTTPPADVGDGGLAVDAFLNFAVGLAVDDAGNVYIADLWSNRVRRVDRQGIITTVAGSPTASSLGDGGPATAARVRAPIAVAVSPDGTLYILQESDSCVRKVDPGGIIETIVGACGSYGFAGDGGAATEALLDSPQDLALGPDGSLYISDYFNNRVRRVTPDGVINTYAGNGEFTNGVEELRGDGGPATSARLDYPVGITMDREGTLLIADLGASVIRAVTSTGYISTIAGNGSYGYSGDGGPAKRAEFAYPVTLAVAPDGALLVADADNRVIRKIATAYPEFQLADILIASQDGSELYRFDGSGKHISTINALTGHAESSFQYDPDGYLVSITDDSGNATTFERTAAGILTGIVSDDGHRTDIQIDPDGYLARVSNPAGESYEMLYQHGLLKQFKRPLGNASTMNYDAGGRLELDQNAGGGGLALARVQSNEMFRVSSMTQEGRTTEYTVTHLATGDQERINTAADGTQTQELLSPAAGARIVTAPHGTRTELFNGPDPRFGMQAPTSGHELVATPNGVTRSMRIEQSAALNNSDVLSLYSLTESVFVNDREFRSDYLADSRTFTTTSAAGRQRRTMVDAAARPVLAETEGIAAVMFGYDPRGRLSAVNQGAGAELRTWSFSHYASGSQAGYLSSITDPIGRVTGFEYDPVGRIAAQILPGDRRIAYGYDANGNLTSITPPGRDAHVFRYTSVDLNDQYTPPDVGAGTNVTSYTFDLDKRVTQIARPDGQTIDFDYLAPGQKLSAINTPSGTYGYAYKPTSGQLDTLTAPGGQSLAYTYDGFLLTSEAASGEVAGTVAWTHDNNFWVTSQSVNTDSLSFTYDADGLLTGAGSLTLTRSPQNGLITGTTLGGITTSSGYNTFAELATASASYSGNPLYQVDYGTRDKLGRIVEKTETILGQTHTTTYGYDLAGRLETVALNGTTISTYVYDANGNRRFHNAVEGTYDAQDRLLTYGNASYTYTANGELKTKSESGVTTTYGYDVLGNLRTVTLPGDISLEYVIDGRNRRVGKKVNGTLTQAFLYQDQLNPVAELDASGNLVSRFVYADKANVPSYMIKAGTAYRIISDHLGSPRLVVNASTGEVVQRMDYDEFGNVTNDTNPGFQPFGFAGGIYDLHTGLVRFGARDYDPQTGRWTAKDPIGFAGGDGNMYAYIGNDPISLVDPTGLAPCRTGITLLDIFNNSSLGQYIGEHGSVTLAVNAGNGVIGITGSLNLTPQGTLTGNIGIGWGVGFAATLTGDISAGTSSGWGVSSTFAGGTGVAGALASGTVSTEGSSVLMGGGLGVGAAVTAALGYTGHIADLGGGSCTCGGN